MKRIAKASALFVAIALAGCVAIPSPAEMARLKSDSDEAMRMDANCASANIAKVDDGFSDASSVALALSSVCIAEYARATEVFGLANLDNDAQRRMFRDRRDRMGTKVESYLPLVMSYRSWLRTKNAPKP
jgi:hypothetical protein